MNIKRQIPFIPLLLSLSFTIMSSQTPAFPGAEGFGKYTTGGRGGYVYEVTNLDDNGPGSLRAGIDAVGARTIVFRVSGTIFLASNLTIRNGDLTIAGQTAPGDGITVAGYPLQIRTDNIILRFLRFRLGDINPSLDDQGDAMNAADSPSAFDRIIVDHCSMSWSIDEVASFYNNTNFTLQWSIISEGMYRSVHSKGVHGYGGIWGGQGATFHHNLLAHNTSRNPRFNGSRYSGRPDLELVDFTNNVLYNWGFNSMYGGEGGSHNIRSNYLRPGPATATGDKQYRIVQPLTSSGIWGRFYVADNVIAGYPAATADNWGLGVQGITMTTKNLIRVDTVFSVVPVTTQPPAEAYASVLDGVGAIYPKRDSIDMRIIGEVRTGSATYGGTYAAPNLPSGIIDSQNDVGGWPVLLSTPAPADNDHDGMPDDWESANGLNTADPGDRNGDVDGDGYTNLEEYLNSLTVNPNYLPGPISLSAVLIGTNSIGLSWTDQSDTETGHTVERASTDTFHVVATLPSDVTMYMDSSLADTTTYRYRVRAFNDSLMSAWSDVASAKTYSPALAPLAASGPYPANGANYIDPLPTLRWEKGLGTASFELFLGTDPGSLTSVTTTVDTSFQTDSLLPATTYYWRVDAINSFGSTESDIWHFTTADLMNRAMAIHWTFDEGGGRNAIDSSSHAILGTLTNMASTVWIPGIKGSALSFDGVDDHVYVSANPALSQTRGSFTVSVWLKPAPATFNGSSQYILHNGSFTLNAGAGRSGRWYGLWISGTELRFAVDDNAAQSTVAATNAQSLLDHEWNHIVGVRDSSSAQLRLYINGSLVATVVDGTGSIDETEPMYIGTSQDKLSPFTGGLDEIRIVRYPMSDGEITAMYGDMQTGVEDQEVVPEAFALLQNYPNPFNPATDIRYRIAEISSVRLTVFDILGREIAVLKYGEMIPGTYSSTWDAGSMPSGIYFYRLEATVPDGERFVETRKMMLLR